jgi:Membrane-associated phospholipid phosphatase
MTILDGQILLWIQDNLRNSILTPIFKFITHLGDVGIVWIALTVLCLVFIKYRKVGCLAAFSLIGSVLINNLILKNLIARVRPYEAVAGLNRIIEAQSDHSFPSGHTGASFAAAVIFFIYLPKRFGIPALVLAVLISFSRLYVGVHYVTDVIAGALISTAIAIIIWQIDKHRHKSV